MYAVSGSSFLEITYKSIECFANDGKLLPNELESLVALALKDGVVCDDEKRVLRNIIGRLTASELTADMLDKLDELKKKYGI